jgi:hypothetical protein
MKFKDTIQEVLAEQMLDNIKKNSLALGKKGLAFAKSALDRSQNWFGSVKDSLISAVSPVAASAILVKNAISLYKANSIKKVRLIFPEQDWELKAVTFLQKIGLVTGVYESLDDAKNFANMLIKQGIKADEFVIGSHGSPGLLLMNRSGDYYSFDNSFLDGFKPLLKPNTTVFFTACHGADFLETLKDAADTLGVGVYGSSGIYNYVTNSSENGFYYCSAGEFKKPTTGKTIKPYFIKNKLKEIDFNIEVNIKNMVDKEGELTYNIFVKGGVIDIPKFKNLIPMDKTITAKSKTYDTKSSTITRYYKDLNNGYENHQLEPIHEIMLSLPSFSDMDDYTKVFYSLAKGFDNGQITVSVATKDGYKPLQSFKSFGEPGEVDNNFSLSSGMCKKVSRSPVSWL